MSLLPVRPGRLDDPVFLKDFREHVTLELLELLTDSGSKYYGPRANIIFDCFQRDGILPAGDRLVNGMFIRCCQEIRLTHDETNKLIMDWFRM
ncbi:MAG: hypothetical protein A3C61_00855 [Candidatus Yanofskybacteria bacterium RIFCSPHIGHO2_02_FULL_39_10]|uniref:Uncharacterized protein n=1 Tax=Candidatus Yanofskybacteria bacterium RIFCSPHIGHO2_02_FULL_39_10 TaxID=1802674 RepID=A0A1F8F4A8_9BACT|nr:MAG: hypothetical protein A3C61_00855 [Candidatus Yanofskybacteria bacterium RIFCSPHIGHO2_02_FULL_39_10]